MNQPLYKRIAVASAFSPRFEQVLAEAKRVRDRLGSALDLIYVGEKDAETTRRFQEALAAMQLAPNSKIHYQQGAPAEAILAACGKTVDEVDVYVPHQANVRIIDHAAKKLGFPSEKVIVNVEFGRSVWEDGIEANRGVVGAFHVSVHVPSAFSTGASAPVA